MGRSPDQLEREIETLRGESQQITAELARRMQDIADVRTQVRLHPAAAALTGTLVFSLVGLLTWLLFYRIR